MGRNYRISAAIMCLKCLAALAEIVFAYFVHYNEFSLMLLDKLNLNACLFNFQIVGIIIKMQGKVAR